MSSAPMMPTVLAANTLRLDLAAARAISALRDANIRVVLLKGRVIARWLYDAIAQVALRRAQRRA